MNILFMQDLTYLVTQKDDLSHLSWNLTYVSPSRQQLLQTTRLDHEIPGLRDWPLGHL